MIGTFVITLTVSCNQTNVLRSLSVNEVEILKSSLKILSITIFGRKISYYIIKFKTTKLQNWGRSY